MTRTGNKTYRGPEVCRVAGISYRQLDWWARTGLLTPSVAPGQGSGYQRLYSEDDLTLARSIRYLLDRGVSLQRIREWAERGEGDQIGIREAIRRGDPQWNPGIRLDLTSLRAQSVDTDARLSA